jgi:hypothetical protein
MKKNTTTNTLLIILAFAPAVSFAALDGVKGLLIGFSGILRLLIPILFGLSLVYFLWGVGQFILHDAGNDKTREEGKKKIMWGIIALFVFVSIYGILGAIGSAINIPIGASGGSYSAGAGGGTAGAGGGTAGGGTSGGGSGGIDGGSSDTTNPPFPTPGECAANPDLCQNWGQ